MSQGPQTLGERYRPDNQEQVICDRPADTQLVIVERCICPIRILLATGHRRTLWLSGLHTAPEARQATPIAEAVDQDDGRQRACSQVDEGGIPAKDGGIAKLEERAQQRSQSRSVRVSETKLVEVVNMSDAKVQRGDKHHMTGRDMRQQVQRNDS